MKTPFDIYIYIFLILFVCYVGQGVLEYNGIFVLREKAWKTQH